MVVEALNNGIDCWRISSTAFSFFDGILTIMLSISNTDNICCVKIGITHIRSCPNSIAPWRTHGGDHLFLFSSSAVTTSVRVFQSSPHRYHHHMNFPFKFPRQKLSKLYCYSWCTSVWPIRSLLHKALMMTFPTIVVLFSTDF